MNDPYGTLIEPAPVPFRFGAPGWYVLGVLCLLGIGFLVWLIWRHHEKNKYRTAALLWLDHLQQSLSGDGEYKALVYETAMLLKRIAISRYGRKPVAALRGEEWARYFNTTWKARAFDEKDADLLSGSVYRSQPIGESDAAQFMEKAKKWIKEHKPIQTHAF